MLKKRIFAGMSAAAIALSMMSMTSFAEGGRVKLFTNGIEEQNAGVIIPVFTTGGSYWSVEDDEQVAALLTDPNYKISFLDDDDVDSLYFYVSGDAIPSFYSDTADVYDNSIYSDRIIESLMDIYPDADLANATYFDFDNSYRAGSHPTAPVVTYEPMLIKADEGLYTINNARLPYGCASVVAVPPVGTEVSEEEPVEIELLSNDTLMTTFTMGVKDGKYFIDIQDMSGVIMDICDYEDTIQLKAPEGFQLSYEFVKKAPTVVTEDLYYRVVDPQAALANGLNDFVVSFDMSNLYNGTTENDVPMLVDGGELTIYISNEENAAIEDCEKLGTVPVISYTSKLQPYAAMRVSVQDVLDLLAENEIDASEVGTLLATEEIPKDGMTDEQYQEEMARIRQMMKLTDPHVTYAPGDADDDLLKDLDPLYQTVDGFFYQLEDIAGFFKNPENRLYVNLASKNFNNSYITITNAVDESLASPHPYLKVAPSSIDSIDLSRISLKIPIDVEENTTKEIHVTTRKDEASDYYYVTAEDILSAMDNLGYTLEDYENMYIFKGTYPAPRFLTANYGTPVEIDVFDGAADNALEELGYTITDAEGNDIAGGTSFGGKLNVTLSDGTYTLTLNAPNHAVKRVAMTVEDGVINIEGDTHLYKFGDFNGDGELDYRDAMAAVQVANGNKKPEDDYLYRVLDVHPTEDITKVDYRDVLTLIQAVNGKIDLWTDEPMSSNVKE